VLILKRVKVLCFDTLLQVLILKELEGAMINAQNLPAARRPKPCLRGAPLLVDDLISKKKKRERTPAVKAQILTGFIIAGGSRYVKGILKE
jgi:hypothetical protein